MKKITAVGITLAISAVYTYGCYRLGVDLWEARHTCNKLKCLYFFIILQSRRGIQLWRKIRT